MMTKKKKNEGQQREIARGDRRAFCLFFGGESAFCFVFVFKEGKMKCGEEKKRLSREVDRVE